MAKQTIKEKDRNSLLSAQTGESGAVQQTASMRGGREANIAGAAATGA